MMIDRPHIEPEIAITAIAPEALRHRIIESRDQEKITEAEHAGWNARLHLDRLAVHMANAGFDDLKLEPAPAIGPMTIIIRTVLFGVVIGVVAGGIVAWGALILQWL